MKKALIALGVVLVALLAIVAAPQAGASPTMHNCPKDGAWSIAVWTGDETDAGEALGTCGNIEVAYALTPTGAWLRYIADAPEINNLETLNQYQGVIALGGPTVPVAEPETNVSLFGTLPDDCTELAVAIRSAGDGTYHARTGLHTKPLTVDGGVATDTWTQMPIAKEVCFYCDGEFLVCVDMPAASGDAHHYTVEIVIDGDQYVIPPRQHEYMQFEWELQEDGTYRVGRLGYGGKKPFNQTCPNDAWTWDERDPRGYWCEGYPEAVPFAHECGPDQEPVEGKTYCVR